MLPFLVPVLFTFHIQVCSNLKKKIRLQRVNINTAPYNKRKNLIFRLHLIKFCAETQPDNFQNPLFIHPQARSLALPYLLSAEFSDSRISIRIFKYLLLNALWHCFSVRMHLGNDDDSVTEYCSTPKSEQV